MKGYYREDFLFIFIIVFLFTFLIIFFSIAFRMNSTGQFKMMRDNLEIMMSAFPYLDQEYLEFLKLDERILGFGIYDSGGSIIAKNAPENLPEVEIPYISIDEQDKTLLYIHPINTMEETEKIIYLKLDIEEQLMRMGYMRLLSISLPAVLIVTMVILILLYRRNVNYRNKMASQTQLVRLGEMARMLSHEIKNPLGAIRIQTGFLKRTLPEDNHTPLLMIEEEIQRIISLTTKIGDFIKDPVGRYERIELTAFLEQMPRRFDYPVKFTVEPPGSGHTVFIMANPDRLKSSIENVIQNAIESMEGIKGKRVPIEIKLYEDKKKAVISIADKGCGISKENRKVIFRPFFTTKAKGSGLGLFISQRFIHAVGGKLILNSHKDMGTEVKVILNKV